eukprot:TRINITY_DN9516_c0_g1_i1.p1 TRINITY_DN9516_c0_g1~~TRINITY_DN9516_c0_g1_i1.p1  ORF type:complete len:201 (+),score=32.15 TRINITY_DN9516_c0_g1_i1:212-814(+)
MRAALDERKVPSKPPVTLTDSDSESRGSVATSRASAEVEAPFRAVLAFCPQDSASPAAEALAPRGEAAAREDLDTSSVGRGGQRPMRRRRRLKEDAEGSPSKKTASEGSAGSSTSLSSTISYLLAIGAQNEKQGEASGEAPRSDLGKDRQVRHILELLQAKQKQRANREAKRDCGKEALPYGTSYAAACAVCVVMALLIL